MKLLFSVLLVIGVISTGIYGQSDDDDSTIKPDTTTPDDTTTTEKTTTTSTTTTTAATTTAVPVHDGFYRIKSGNTTCIMLDGDFTIVVSYNTTENKVNKVHVKMPKPSANVKVDGSCDTNSSYIEFTWGIDVPKSRFRMDFNASSDLSAWSIKSLLIVTSLNEEHFANASDQGKTLNSYVNLETAPLQISANHSYKCFTRAVASNISSDIDNIPYGNTVVLEMDGVQIEAFNQIANEPDFVDGTHCSQDEIADIVPIAVGVALAILVIIVLVAYLVGRKRRAATYQSV